MFDADQVSLGNLTTYPSTNFTGSTLFEVATDTQGTPDTVYGTNVIYERLGLINDIRLQDTFNSDKVQFVIMAEELKCNFYKQRGNYLGDFKDGEKSGRGMYF